ncbi:MAG: TetR/AcrR family transcriptional regulator [Neomegalonema sp.]|nr:TetR/AcrR family transcriptional regulator [Neomegalonema sp.]
MSKRGYHHGDLRNALIEAARSLIAENGPSGFSVAEAARKAGVSPAAPYRHFKDRDALISAVAIEGFNAFADALETAWSGADLTPLRALDALGAAYLEFAAREPAYFVAMFGTPTLLEQDAALCRAADRAFAVLTRAVELVAAPLPPSQRPPVLMMAHHFWALAHGTAVLFGDGAAQNGRAPIAATELLESGVALYLRGVGILPDLD